MTKIEPALTREQWASVPAEWENSREPLTGVAIAYTNGTLPIGDLSGPFSPHALIALVNAALPVGDPRKFARFDVRVLREQASELESILLAFLRRSDYLDALDRFMTLGAGWANNLRIYADQIESLLPPE